MKKIPRKPEIRLPADTIPVEEAGAAGLTAQPALEANRGGIAMTGTNGNNVLAQELPTAAYSAVERLTDVKTHQWSPMHEMRHNWRGWIGSFAFHALVLALLAGVTWTVILHEKRPTWIVDTHKMQPLAEPLNQQLPYPFDKAPFDTKIEGPPSLNRDGVKPSLAYPGLEDDGVPPWIGRGPWRGDSGPGGPPGDRLAGRPFRELIKKEYHELDVVFVFDSTGSMGGILLEVKTRIRQFMSVVRYLVPDTRLGLVTYRDHRKHENEDYQYTVKYIPLTQCDADGREKLQRFLRGTEAYGGGDIPEAVHEGLLKAIHRAGWRTDAKKIIIVFGDAPPRPENDGLNKICKLAADWHKNTGGIVSCIDTTGDSKLLEEFKDLAESGGGQSCFLNSERAIIRQLVLYLFPKEYAPDVDEVWKKMSRDAEEDTILRK